MQPSPFVQKEWVFWLLPQDAVAKLCSATVPALWSPQLFSPKNVILLLLSACVSFWMHFQNSWGWGHLLALKLAGWQLSLTSSTNDQGKNWFCQGIWGPTSSQEEFCWALCEAVVHFLLILIYSACWALLRLCTNLVFFGPPLLWLCPECKRALGKKHPIGLSFKQTLHPDNNDGNSIIRDWWASKNDFSAQFIAL